MTIAARLTAIVLLLATASAAVAQSQWEAYRQNPQHPAARLQLPAGTMLRAIAITCDKGRPLMALRLATPPAFKAARGRLMVGGASHDIGLARLGTSETWVVPVTDPGLLNHLAAEDGVASLYIANAPPATFPLTGASAAFAETLSDCYQPAPSSAATRQSPATHSGLSAADAAAIEKTVRRAFAYDDKPPSIWSRRAAAISAECTALQSRYDQKFGDLASFGLCTEDVDMLCQCQDMDEAVMQRTLRITATPSGPNSARATARFALFAGEPADNSTRLDLVKTAAGWQIDQVGEQQRLQLDNIANMRRKLNLPVWTPPAAA